MHTYSINSEERKYVVGALGIFSVIIVYSLRDVLPQGWPVPTVMSLFGVLFLAFNKWLWKLRWLHWLGVVKTPNLNGEWEMITKSSKNNYAKEYQALLTITQTWTEIHLFMDGQKATSESKMANIHIDNPKNFLLKYEYFSVPKPEFSDSDNKHYGLTTVRIEPGSAPLELNGNYFTEPGRHTFGSVKLIKKA